MQYVYVVVMGLHVLSGVYWAGTTIALARDAEMRAEKFFPSQMRSAGLVMLTGALLWYFFHGAYFGSMEIGACHWRRHRLRGGLGPAFHGRLRMAPAFRRRCRRADAAQGQNGQR